MREHATKQFSDADIERAMATVARVIELYGDAYWPILERLERELEERQAKANRLARHLSRFDARKSREEKVAIRTRAPVASPEARRGRSNTNSIETPRTVRGAASGSAR